MRILHIATLVTPNGAYGGPIRVAINQCRALLAAGHDVTFAAGATGFGRNMPQEFDGLPVKLFHAFKLIPGMGFAALAAPGLQHWLRTELDAYDVVHVHLARDLVTLPAARLARKKNLPYVVQTHGMVVHSDHFLARPLDALWTKRILVGAHNVLHLTPAERNGIVSVSAAVNSYVELRNGVPTHEALLPESKRELEVLFMARLHVVKRPVTFVKMAIKLNKSFPDVAFRLVGPDEGEGKVVRKLISESDMGDRLSWDGPLNPNETLARMSHSTIYVLPSERDAFPMSILEAMSLGVPVVVTPGCGLADHIAAVMAGVVADDSVDGLVHALRPMLEDPQYTAALGRNAKRSALVDFNISDVASDLDKIYNSAIFKGF